MFTDARRLGFPSGTFDIAICGFMGWDDCYDFRRGNFTKPDTKGKEILRALKNGGRFICCSWEEQEDLRWMEEEILHHYPAILEDTDYQEERPIGMSYEKAEGYVAILENAGFRDISFTKETLTCVSTDEEEWWRQMKALGWDSLLVNIACKGNNELTRVKEHIFKDLQRYKRGDGIHFDKVVFFVRGEK